MNESMSSLKRKVPKFFKLHPPPRMFYIRNHPLKHTLRRPPHRTYVFERDNLEITAAWRYSPPQLIKLRPKEFARFKKDHFS